ncbi:MAG: serine hydrolase [Microcoleaceae cyanobacterium]
MTEQKTVLPNEPLPLQQRRKRRRQRRQELSQQKKQYRWQKLLRLTAILSVSFFLINSYYGRSANHANSANTVNLSKNTNDQNIVAQTITEKPVVPKLTVHKFTESAVLKNISETSGLSDQAKISVCSLQDKCWHLYGNQPPTRVASLMKLPIAIALIHKADAEKINLKTKILLDRKNFTEDNSNLSVDQQYSLEDLLSEMIINSSNIAPNQLIDYLGKYYINETLAEAGYQVTRVNSKFTGANITPPDAGLVTNMANSDELTAMMIKIYQKQLPGYDLLIKILAQQHDHDFGFAALQGKQAKWLGEKTGQTSQVLGTTVAMSIKNNIYVTTVIDDGEYNEQSIRDAISQIADYLANRGEL